MTLMKVSWAMKEYFEGKTKAQLIDEAVSLAQDNETHKEELRVLRVKNEELNRRVALEITRVSCMGAVNEKLSEAIKHLRDGFLLK
jgi:hypothetical protein